VIASVTSSAPAGADARAAQATVLVVDDTPANLTLMAQVLRPHWRVQLAVSADKALALASQAPPDLVLLDIMMPGVDGYEVCRRLKSDGRTRDVPVVFLTALSGAADETAAFDAGAADFVTKPFNSVTLLSRVRTHLSLKLAQDRLKGRNADLSGELHRRRREVDALRDTTLFVMVALAEFRDGDTGAHIQRTQAYVRVLAAWLAAQGRVPWLTPQDIEALARSAPLHDIGKVAIPDQILLKPGRLSAEEWAVMKTHTTAGAELLQRAVDRLGDDAGVLLRYGWQIARHHHERWDGSGYPDGLAGAAIPLAARLMAVADVYDALISRRPYKDPMPHEQAVEFISAGSGTQFDPQVVAALLACQPEMRAIAEQFHD
jgi:putative two-component system response regulator